MRAELKSYIRGAIALRGLYVVSLTNGSSQKDSYMSSATYR